MLTNGDTTYRVVFLTSPPPKKLKYFFFNWTPPTVLGGPIQKNYFNFLGGGEVKKTTLY